MQPIPVVIHDARYKPTLRTSLTVLSLQIAFLKAMLRLPVGQPDVNRMRDIPQTHETHGD